MGLRTFVYLECLDLGCMVVENIVTLLRNCQHYGSVNGMFVFIVICMHTLLMTSFANTVYIRNKKLQKTYYLYIILPNEVAMFHFCNSLCEICQSEELNPRF